MSEIKTVDIKGLLDTYEFPYTLPGSGQELLLRPITTGQMKRILVYEDEEDPYVIEEALDKLVSDCVVTPDFDVNSLYLQDRFSLLIEIRKITKGDDYEFGYNCPKCGMENRKTVDLSKLNIGEFNLEDNIIEINDRLKFEVNFPTRQDQLDALREIAGKKLGYKEKQVEVQLGTFANCVDKVHTPQGILEDVVVGDILYILDNIPSDVFARFTNWFNDREFGVEFSTKFNCISCQHEEGIDIPLTSFFD